MAGINRSPITFSNQYTTDHRPQGEFDIGRIDLKMK
jgi:hypothetical protein